MTKSPHSEISRFQVTQLKFNTGGVVIQNLEAKQQDTDFCFTVACDQVTTRNGSRTTSRTLHVFHPTVKICNKIPIHIPHTCAWCVTYQKRNETLFCLMAHINMHVVAIRSSLYGLHRFLDEMGVAQHRAHGTFFLPKWKFVTKYLLICHTRVHDA